MDTDESTGNPLYGNAKGPGLSTGAFVRSGETVCRSVTQGNVFLDDLRSHEHQQLGLVILAGRVLEQSTDQRQVAEEGHHVDLVQQSLFVDTAQYDRLTVVHQNLGADFAGIDTRHLYGTGGEDLADSILVDLQVHHDAVIGSDLRGDCQSQYRLAKGDRGGAAGRCFQIRYLDTLFDIGFMLVGRDHPWAGDDFAGAFSLHGREFQFQQGAEGQFGQSDAQGTGSVAARQIDVEAAIVNRVTVDQILNAIGIAR